MRADEEVANRGAELMHIFEPLPERGVRANQGREVNTPKWNRLTLRTQDQPTQNRQHDHERVQRHMHRFCGDLLPSWRVRYDLWRPSKQVHQDPGEH